MQRDATLRFKIASEEREFEAVHRLNYRTFVEEIPQHGRNAERRLVDHFHAENTYAICLEGDRLVGMICGRSQRPFSLDQKIPCLDSHLPPGRKVVEMRLLAVEPEYRKGVVFCRLAGLLARHFIEQGFDLAVISGSTRQLKLYRHLGFVAFGPQVGAGDARFQPMYLKLESFARVAKAVAAPRDRSRSTLASFLCGPVPVHEQVRKRFVQTPESHRSDRFLADFRATKRLLCDLVEAKHVEILLGSGTLANEAVCAQLSLLGQPGLVLSNGEFGERLIDHASRQRLKFEIERSGWGEPFDYRRIRVRLAAGPRIGWVWAVHGETSTGVLNDLAALQDACAEHGVKLCLDCISSIGAVPVNLAGIHLASCVSGKALASFSGLSMVFYNQELQSAPRALPRYLDLGYYAEQGGVPFTTSSNLVRALQAALARVSWPQKYRNVAQASAWLRHRLRAISLQIVAPDAFAAPAVVTLALPPDISSKDVGERLTREGLELGYQSRYLLQRNWIQIALMGEWSRFGLETLLDALAGIVAKSANAGKQASERLSATSSAAS